MEELEASKTELEQVKTDLRQSNQRLLKYKQAAMDIINKD
jgi:hypothetical protein